MPRQPVHEHFGEYRQQTAVKHRILEAYLPAYYTALSGSFKRFAYIDGFAGRGTYTDSATGDRHPGSPIRALALFEADEKLRSCVDVLFVESDKSMYKELREAVEAFVALRTGTRAPAVVEGRFADQVPPFLSQLRQLHGGRLPPTFLFVDPCGVEGVDFKTISSVLREPTCELFLLFNSAGLRRIIGADKGQGESPTLLQLYGDPLTVKDL